MSSARSRFWGIVLLAAGLVLLAANLGWLSLARFEWMPILVILAGVWLAVVPSPRRQQRVTAGVVLLAVGLFWMADTSGWLRQEHFVPVLLIALGAGLLLRGVPPRAR